MKLGREKEEKRNDGIKGDIGKREKRGEMEERIEVLEKWWEMTESEKRERNIIIKRIKGVKEEKEELERRVEQIWKVLDVEVRIVEIKSLEKGRREWGE